MMLRAALAAVLMTLAGPMAAHADEVSARPLTVALPAGPLGHALQRAVLDPFAATGAPVHAATREPGLDSLVGAAAHWDVVLLSPATLGPACQGGLLE